MSPFRPRPALACAALLLIVTGTVSCQSIAPSYTGTVPASVGSGPAAGLAAVLSAESAVAYGEADERITAARSVEGLAAEDARPGYRDQGRDRFEAFDPNPVKVAAEEPVSTFSIDVDTASYAFMRASLNRGALPQPDAVRVEELINYFAYDYAPPESSARPFAVHVSLMPTPWNEATRLMHIGIKGYALAPESRPPANLVFLIDTSGSMDSPDKLPLAGQRLPPAAGRRWRRTTRWPSSPMRARPAR